MLAPGVKAQEPVNPVPANLNKVLQEKTEIKAPDTIPLINLTEEDLNTVTDIRSQFEKQNKTYSSPVRPSQGLLRFLNRDKLEMSPEAKRLVSTMFDASRIFDQNMTFRDTVIVNPLFLPFVFKGYFDEEDYNFYDPNRYNSQYLLQRDTLPLQPFMASYVLNKKTEKKIYRNIISHYPDYIQYSVQDLPNDRLVPAPIQINIRELYESPPLVAESNVAKDVSEIEGPPRFIPDRLYWISGFESVVQFSQNYVSHNWHKGGSSNLNLFTKNYLRYDYKKDKVQIVNEMEIKTSVYNAPKDTMNKYKIGDDLLRIHSNVGLQAYNKWYYTFDAEFRTQMFTNYKENSKDKQAALLAPFTITLGLGMKYDLNKTFKEKHKNLKLALNLAPLSYSYMKSASKNIDLGRHGFEKDPETGQFETTRSQFGSTVNADFNVKFNRNVNWQSRLNYFTSYDRVLCEFENTLVMSISRFFSTRIYFYLRYDDGVEPSKKDRDLGYFQVNEILSFGFNYKW